MTWLRAGLRELPGSILQKRAPPSPRWRLKTKPEQQSRSEWEGKKGEGRRGNGGIFSFSYIDDSNIPPASKSPRRSRSSTGKLFEIQRQARRCAHAHSRTCAHIHKKACKAADIVNHTPNKYSVQSEMRTWQQLHHSLKVKIQLRSVSGSERG